MLCRFNAGTVILLACLTKCASFPQLTTTHLAFGGGVFVSSMIIAWYITFQFKGQCSNSRANFHPNVFDLYIRDHLYGQHLATWTISRSLKAHVLKTEPKKALVMSFHGWTGSGKNYASKMIASTLYDQGSQSPFVHWYIATRDFPHLAESNKYRTRLQQEITKYTKQCGQSLFIFDEIDKMAPGIIDAIKPFIDFYDDIEGVDYRKNIFIFLSNAGGSEITRVAFNFWLDGKEREDLSMKDIEPLVNLGAFNERGGLQFSEIVKNNLIDIYVPFLPLEKSHIRKCIQFELQARGQTVNEHIINKIASQILFYPPQFELYSGSGCKKISHKIDLYGSES